MNGRSLRISLLIFVAVWFGVIVPGHRRGQIALAGWQPSCCAVPKAIHGVSPSKDQPTCPPAACAVCHLLATLDLPTAVQLDVPPLGFITLAAHAARPNCFIADQPSLRFDRGPPVV
jgi:hypothetical protein